MSLVIRINPVDVVSPISRGKALQKARKEKGLEQQDIAKVLGVNKKNISDWETARVKSIPEDKFKKWIALLEIDPDVVFRTIALPELPATTYRRGVVRELIGLALYAAEHIDEEWITKDFEYTRNVKNDMRELMEIYLKNLDEDTSKSK